MEDLIFYAVAFRVFRKLLKRSLKKQPRKKNQKCIIYVSNLCLKNVSKAV